VRVGSLPSVRQGSRVLLDISDVDLLELTLHCEFVREIGAGTENMQPGTVAAAAEQ